MRRQSIHQHRQFDGFEHLAANYIYCPNQFFDVCLPHNSRSTVRLVAYLLRTTLGTLDEDGNPTDEIIRVSYEDITANAGVSTRSIPKAIDSAISGGFILRVKAGKRAAKGQRGERAHYTLRWAERGVSYTTDSQGFAGFFSGDGNRSRIPNGFFDHVIRRETLAIIKVVGTVLRYTVGYTNRYGTGRRSHAPLSYSKIRTYANLNHKATLRATLQDAVKRGYIKVAQYGCFDPDGGKTSRATSYAVQWLDRAEKGDSTAKTEPGKYEHGKNQTGSTAKTEPEEHGKNRTDRKTRKDNSKQHNAAVENSEAMQLLIDRGFDSQAAATLSKVSTLAKIRQQIDWLPLRNVTNRLGCLRRAIEGDWTAPDGATTQGLQLPLAERYSAQKVERQAQQAKTADRRKKHVLRRQELLRGWKPLSVQERERLRADAVTKAPSNNDLKMFRTCDLSNPPTAMLELLADHLTPVGVGD